jgi:hypothetical protein
MPVQPPPSQFARPRALGLILPLSFVFLFLHSTPPLAAPIADNDPPREVGGSDQPSETLGPRLDLSSLETEVSVFAGYSIFSESDMYDTYAGLPQIGCELSVGLDEEAEFVMGIRYGGVSGDPFYDTLEFEGNNDVSLRAVPITLGFRINASKNPRFRLYWGACFEAAWMEERVPSFNPDSLDPRRTDRGWGKGLRLSLTPEWRSHDQRRALGLSFEWGGSSGEVGSGYHDHEVNMIGIGANLHYSQSL